MSPSSVSAPTVPVRDLLAQSQNPDGGWGYFPRKQSWLEPTAYAWLALLNTPNSAPVLERALALILSWQRPDGGWSPNGQVKESTWVTSLALTVLSAARQTSGAPFQRGIDWLMGFEGSEGGLFNRLTARLGLVDPGRDVSLTGWPWLAGTSSWVEPTAHALTALRKAAGRTDIAARIDTGAKQIWSLRCADGGWNYGAPNALHVNLPSYPETTALALIALAGTGQPKLSQAVDHARALAAQPQSPMASAWLTIALRLHGAEPPASLAAPGPESDLLVNSLYALAEPTGNWHLLGGAR
ncbi:MAG: prenyltransferase/squalene oxidase repeat-containing protein [Acidobacteriota bacterium]